MTRLETFFHSAPPSVVDAIPDGAVIGFELSGVDGGHFTVVRQGRGVEVLRKRVGFADCRLACTVDDFFALINGRLHPREGFLEGRLRVEGDVGLVLRIEQALRKTPRGGL